MALLANDIYIGSVNNPAYHFSNRSFASDLSGAFGLDVVGNELSIDTFTFTVRHEYESELIYAPKGHDGYLDTNDKLYRLRRSGIAQYYDFVPNRSDKLVEANDKIFRTFAGYASDPFLFSLPFGAPVYWYVKGSFFAKGYLKQVERLSKYNWKVTCVSGIGLLDVKNHVGGLYNGETFLNIVRDIIGGAFSFTCDSAVGETLIYGHLPYGTARDNLHQLMFAVGAAMTKGTASNDYVIKFLSDVSNYVPSNIIALGGSVSYQTPATRVEVTEHAYYAMASDEVVTLYDNTSGTAAQNTLVVFNDPVHDLDVTSSLRIVDSGVNYAVVSGVGVLTGKKYTHNETEIAINRGGSDAPNIKSVKNNHLISFANSNNVAQRVLDYYSSAKKIKAKIMLKGERVGENISFTNPFDEAASAYIDKMDVTVTSVIGAQCELVEGFTPTGAGNNFTNRVVITANGTWQVPAGTELIRIVLIGGGQGGAGGYDGEDGCWYEGGVGAPDSAVSVRGEMTAQFFWFSDRESPWESGDFAYCFSGGVGYADEQQREPQGGDPGEPGTPGKIIVYDQAVQAGDTITLNIGVGGSGGSRNGGAGSAGGNTTAQCSRFGTLTSADGASSDNGYYDTMTETLYALPGDSGSRGGNGGMTDTVNDHGTNGANGRPGQDVGSYRGGKGGRGKATPIEVWYYDEDGVLKSREFTQETSGGGGGGAAYGAAGGSGGNASIISKHEDGDRFIGDQYLSGIGGNGANASAPPQAGSGNGGTGGNGGGGGGNLGGVYGFCGFNTAQERLDLGNGDVDYGGSGFSQGHGGQGSTGGQGGNGLVIIYY